MFILSMAIKLAGRRFQDVGRRQATGWDAPPIAFQQESSLRLCARQTELPGVAGKPPCGVVLTQKPESFGDLFLIKPFDAVRGAAQHLVKPLWPNELHGAGAILADIGDQAERIAGGNLKL